MSSEFFEEKWEGNVRLPGRANRCVEKKAAMKKKERISGRFSSCDAAGRFHGLMAGLS